MAILTLEEVLSPFEFLDIARLYDRYSSGIDFTIAFFLFLGIARATLGKRFEGRAGKTITVAISFALAIGFSLMERELNFSLRSFGPLGAFVVSFVVSVVLFGLFRAVGISHTSSLCTSYIIVYLSMRLISPNVFDWIAQKAPFINGILGLAFIIAGIKLVLSLFRRGKSITDLSNQLKTVPQAQKQAVQREIEEEEVEKDLVGKKMRRLTRKDLRTSHHIINYLNHILETIDRYGNTEEGRQQISKELAKISDAEHHMLAKLDYLQKLNAKIERRDAAKLQELEQKHSAAAGKEKDLLEKEVELENKKVNAEDSIYRLKEQILQLTNGFNESVNAAINTLVYNGYPQDAQKDVQQAIKYEAQISQLFKDANSLEKELQRLIGKEQKAHKRQ